MKASIYMILAGLLISLSFVGCSRDNDQTVKEMNAEAMKLAKAGQHGRALEKAREALKKLDEMDGSDFADRVNSLEIMGLMYQALGEQEDAEIAFLRALSVVRKYAGPNSVEEVKITNNLAGLYYAQNQYDLALSFFKKSLSNGEKVFPPGDPRLEVMRKNIKACEEKKKDLAAARDEGKKTAPSAGDTDKAAKSEAAPGPGLDEDSAAADNSKSVAKTKSVNFAYDMVPQKVKDSVVSQMARQNIFISDLEPKPLVPIDDKGVVFPYHALKKEKGKTQEVVVLFAAIKNPEKADAYVFKQCRLISNASYLSALEKGGVVQLKQELKEVFPSLYR